MKKYRIDFIKQDQASGLINDYVTRYFDDLKAAKAAAAEGFRDGYKTWLLEYVISGKYDVVKRLF